jgi:hypothetical protein
MDLMRGNAIVFKSHAGKLGRCGVLGEDHHRRIFDRSTDLVSAVTRWESCYIVFYALLMFIESGNSNRLYILELYPSPYLSL